MNTFKLKIMSPDRVMYDGNASSITVRTGEGEVEMLANHAAIILKTIPTITKVITEKGETKELFTSGGIIKFQNNELNFCSGAIEEKAEIDVERAEKAKKRAEERLKDEKKFDSARAQAALLRAITRLEFKNR